jgi:hypothetical protein
MRMGKVIFSVEYVVDLDKPNQVEVAKEFICEDVEGVIRYNTQAEMDSYIDTVEDSSLTYDDIHTGILELTGEVEEEDD